MPSLNPESDGVVSWADDVDRDMTAMMAVRIIECRILCVGAFVFSSDCLFSATILIAVPSV